MIQVTIQMSKEQLDEAVAQWAASRGFAVSHVGFTVEQDDRTGDRVVRVELEATMDEKKR